MHRCRSNETYREDFGVIACSNCCLDRLVADINYSGELYLAVILSLLLSLLQLPLYLIVSLGCYGLLMVGVGLMNFPTCPQEALFLQQDIVEAREFLKKKGVDVGSD
ncbi:hypothetical protein MTR67_000016 [Solanum verrucosum]|uniref:Dolichol-phosphate mannosyltransferase subunit 3 n=1 Tax=Solanum verrucosum TaxID=315347 RepID=A0AAF0PKX2_SOLVR|nr:hypothetical protein MTR67_000016 [Solanum verrucosum]